MSRLFLAKEIIQTALKMNALGINQGTSGNVSARFESGFLVTPSGKAYEDLKPSDIVFVDLKGNAEEGKKPSSEWRFHLDIYVKRDDLNAVVHTHSNSATSMACQHLDIPAFHYMVAVAGGKDIRCAKYATFGTQQLSNYIIKALKGRKACLMAHHGVIASGKDLKEAFYIAGEVETLADQYIKVCQLGKPKLLTTKQINEAIQKFKKYK